MKSKKSKESQNSKEFVYKRLFESLMFEMFKHQLRSDMKDSIVSLKHIDKSKLKTNNVDYFIDAVLELDRDDSYDLSIINLFTSFIDMNYDKMFEEALDEIE